MNKSGKAAIAVCILSGCAVDGDRNGGSVPHARCGAPPITVVHARGYLALNPETVDPCRGDRLTINLAPPVAPGSARTAPAEGGPQWLRRENKTRGTIYIDVPKDTKPGVYKYSITIDGVGMLDPRVRISEW